MPGTAYNFREERRKEKIRKRMKSGERKYFFQVCLDTKRKRNRMNRCELFYIFILLNYKLIRI